jgi:uncharacterized protein
MDVTPLIPSGKNVIKGYGNKTFKINDTLHNSSIIVFPDKIISWDVSSAKDIRLEKFTEILSAKDLEILLVGCGDVHIPVDAQIHREMQKAGVGLEFMTTGAACRTYNVLLAEGRNVAVALVLV